MFFSVALLQTLKGKSKSSHDLLKDDPRLSAVPAVNKYVIDASTCCSPPLSLQSCLILHSSLLKKGKRRKRQLLVPTRYVKIFVGVFNSRLLFSGSDCLSGPSVRRGGRRRRWWGRRRRHGVRLWREREDEGAHQQKTAKGKRRREGGGAGRGRAREEAQPQVRCRRSRLLLFSFSSFISQTLRAWHFSQFVMCHNDLLGELLTLVMQR